MRKDDFDDIMKRSDGVQVLKDKYALPSIPTHVVDVEVSEGEELELGIAQGHPSWGQGGGVQYRLKNKLDKEAFTNLRPLGHTRKQ